MQSIQEELIVRDRSVPPFLQPFWRMTTEVAWEDILEEQNSYFQFSKGVMRPDTKKRPARLSSRQLHR
jgi:hypothetical protein